MDNKYRYNSRIFLRNLSFLGLCRRYRRPRRSRRGEPVRPKPTRLSSPSASFATLSARVRFIDRAPPGAFVQRQSAGIPHGRGGVRAGARRGQPRRRTRRRWRFPLRSCGIALDCRPRKPPVDRATPSAPGAEPRGTTDVPRQARRMAAIAARPCGPGCVGRLRPAAPEPAACQLCARQPHVPETRLLGDATGVPAARRRLRGFRRRGVAGAYRIGGAGPRSAPDRRLAARYAGNPRRHGVAPRASDRGIRQPRRQTGPFSTVRCPDPALFSLGKLPLAACADAWVTTPPALMIHGEPVRGGASAPRRDPIRPILAKGGR